MLEFDAALTIEAADGRQFAVAATGSNVRVELSDVAPRRTLRLIASSVTLARRLSRVLDRSALTLTLTRDGEAVVELGAGVRGGPLARALGLERVRVIRRR